MNRRGFFKTLAAATAGFTILPPATTYERVWKAARPSLGYTLYDVPVQFGHVFIPMNFMGDWKFIVENNLFGPGAFPKGLHLTQ